MKQQPEYRVQAEFVGIVAIKYPNVVLFSDTAAHINKTARQQLRANLLQTTEKQPDTFIAQPSGEYAGLWIEFKAKTPYKVDGVTLLKNEHIEGQFDTMKKLEAAGYACAFAWTALQAYDILTAYLNGEKIELHGQKPHECAVRHGRPASSISAQDWNKQQRRKAKATGKQNRTRASV